MRMRCPGQDPRFWKPSDVFEKACPGCAAAVEFFKDDASRPCPSCGRRVPNPKLDRGCARWCRNAEECTGSKPATVESPRSKVETPREE